MYFQCDPEVDPERRSAKPSSGRSCRPGFPASICKEGPIFQRDVLRFRSFVAHELRHGRAALVGDAAHTVPPTGAKGMNLAVADVVMLERALRALLLEGDERLIDAYAETALRRIWKAQHFSWWMTSMLHVAPGRERLRPAAPARRALDGRRVGGGPHLPRRGVHRVAAGVAGARTLGR